MLTVIGTFIVILMLGAAAVGAVYRRVLFPVVRFHFGETSRYDRDARRRRRSFENFCIQSLSWFYASSVAGMVRGISSVTMPSIQVWALGAQFITFVVGGLFVWASINRWREPYED